MASPVCSCSENFVPNLPLLSPNLVLYLLALLRLSRVRQLLTERPDFRSNPFFDDGCRIDNLVCSHSMPT